MILGLEIGMLLGGAYALIAGKLPLLLVGGRQYKVEGIPARLIGLLLMTPIPLAFFGGIVLAFLFDQTTYAIVATIGEIGLVLVVAISAVIAVRMARKPALIVDSTGSIVPEVSEVEAQIDRKVNGSIFYLVLGGLGMAGAILCPLVFWRTSQALGLIEKHNVGHQYEGTAKAMRIISAILSVAWIGITLVGCAVLVGVPLLWHGS